MEATLIETLLVMSAMTRDQLREVAKALNVPRGKDTKDVVKNLTDAITSGKARMSLKFKIKKPYPDPSHPDIFMPSLAECSIYTYKEGKCKVSPS